MNVRNYELSHMYILHLTHLHAHAYTYVLKHVSRPLFHKWHFLATVLKHELSAMSVVPSESGAHITHLHDQSFIKGGNHGETARAPFMS